MNIKGKVVIVTGGSRGIGRGISLSLAKEGAKVAVNYHRHPENAKDTAKKIESLGGEAMIASADVTSSSQVKHMVASVIDKWGRIDVLVNNAGHIAGGGLLDITEEEWDKMMAVHLKGTFLCCKEVVPHMIKQRKDEKGWAGKIINISSVGGVAGQSVMHYCTAKGGLITLTQSLARHLAKFNIMVNVIAPGPTVSDLGSSEPNTEEKHEQKRKWARESGKFPLGRIGEPEDIANAVLFLISNDYITGETISISGGWGTLYNELLM